jgi:hypothetical protein
MNVTPVIGLAVVVVQTGVIGARDLGRGWIVALENRPAFPAEKDQLDVPAWRKASNRSGIPNNPGSALSGHGRPVGKELDLTKVI